MHGIEMPPQLDVCLEQSQHNSEESRVTRSGIQAAMAHDKLDHSMRSSADDETKEGMKNMFLAASLRVPAKHGDTWKCNRSKTIYRLTCAGRDRRATGG
jgi:hypothetical protein